jgi:uncharacterized repeat protein (TIGR01451 family)
MKRALFSLLIVGILSTLSVLPNKAFADCQALYGGGQTCTSYTFTVEKLVQVPGAGNFVDNLSINDPRYSLSQIVNFEIVVTNTGNSTISSITLTDTFPQFIQFVSGPGSFNSNNKVLTFAVNNLGAGQSQTFNVSGKVYGSGVPQGITCVVNQVSGVDNNGNTNNSSSQLCIQRTAKITTTPPTGPEMLPLMALIPGALGGIFLRKKSKHNFEGGEK